MIQLAPFSDAHMDAALRLSAQAGWPHRREDWALVTALSEGIVAIEGDKVVGTAFCTIFGGQARLSSIIVDADRRGRGLGRRLVTAIMDIAGDRGITLLATTDGLPLYRGLGFVATGEIVQIQGNLTMPAMPKDLPRNAGVQDLAAILDMDRCATGLDRAALLGRLVRTSRVLVNDGGYVMTRLFGRGQLVGPFVARSQDSARDLLLGAVQGLEGQFVRVDTNPDLGLVPLLAEMGLQQRGGGTVMHLGPPVPPPSQFITYALASHALG